MTVLVLSGGGLWAAAGIGAAAALRDLGVAIDGYVGTSAGALVGALLAAGHAPEFLDQAARALRRKDFGCDWRQWGRRALTGSAPSAVLGVAGLSRRIKPLLHDQGWDTLARPLWVTATSLTRFEPVVFGSYPPADQQRSRFHLNWRGNRAPLWDALMASAAVPGIFPPREVDGDWLVDGGVTDDYPVDVAEWIGATQVVGIWVDERLDQGLPAKFHLGHVIAVSLAVMIRELSLTRQQVTAIPRIDIRLEIDGGHLVFDRVADIIEHGYQSVWAHRDDIRERQLIPEKG